MNLLESLTQMSLLWPSMLWLFVPLLLLAAAFIWLSVRRAARDAQIAGMSMHVANASTGGRLRRVIAPLLFFLGLAALTGAVARPQVRMLFPSFAKDVVLAIDTSGSMRATDIKPDRMRAARQAAQSFIDKQSAHTRIGIVSFAGTASVVQSLTDNREDLQQALERLKPQRGTAIGSALTIALSTLLPEAGITLEQLQYRRFGAWAGGEAKKPLPVGSNRSAAIVLLSDGENTHGPDPHEAAKLAADHGVRIYTVGIGSAEGVALSFAGWSMRARLDDETLRRIAAVTHGEYYAATSAQALNKVYEQLSARLTLERARAVEATAFFAGVGVVLLAFSALLSVLWFNRVL